MKNPFKIVRILKNGKNVILLGEGRKGRTLLGCGHHRSVWVNPDNPTQAIKLCHRLNNGEPNQKEWDIYHNAGADIRQWLARPIEISDDGVWMIVERVKAVKKKEVTVPNIIKTIFRDCKKSANWGRVNGEIKLVDYHRLNKAVTLNGKQFNKGNY